MNFRDNVALLEPEPPLRRLPLAFLALSLACAPKPKAPPPPHADFCADIHRDTTIHLASQLRPFDSLMATKTGVYVLEDGDGAMLARGWLSEYAERSIDVQYFIFSADNVGLIGADYLVRAADRGVKVRILVDDLLVEADGDELLALDSHPNLEIRIYNPDINIGKNLPKKLFSMARDFRGINQRMHNKTFTVDGRIAITGGRNIADEYFDYDHDYNFRDRDVLLLGGVTSKIAESFEEFWASPLSRPIAELVEAERSDSSDAAVRELLRQYACNPAHYWPQVRDKLSTIPAAFERIRQSGAFLWLDGVEYISDPPGKNDGSQGLKGGGPTTERLAQLIQQAKHTIEIQSPYLVTTVASRELFRQAVERGVTVRILTNSLASTDNLEAFSGYQRDRDDLLATGVRIYEFRPDAAERMSMMTGALRSTGDHVPTFGLHAKSMVIDGEIAVIGTFNLDPRSEHLNTECITVIHSRDIAQLVLQGMEVEFQPENAWEVSATERPDGHAGVGKRLKVWLRRVVPKSVL